MRSTPSRCARQNCQEMAKHILAQIPCMCIYWAERGRRLRCSTWRARNKTFAKIRIVWNYPQKGFFAKLTAEERKKSLPTQMWNKALKKCCHSVHSKWWSVLRRNVESAAEALAAVRSPEKDHWPEEKCEGGLTLTIFWVHCPRSCIVNTVTTLILRIFWITDDLFLIVNDFLNFWFGWCIVDAACDL